MRQFFTSSLSSENLFENYYCNKNGPLKDQTKTTTSNFFSNVIFWCFDKLLSSLPTMLSVNFYLLNLNSLHAKIIFVVFCVKCIYPHILQKNMYVSIFKSILKNWLCIILFLIMHLQSQYCNKPCNNSDLNVNKKNF